MKDRLYIASISRDASELAKKYGIGLELDQYCTARNMEAPYFDKTNRQVRKEIEIAGNPPLILHAPFNELYPAAIDPAVREIAVMRYEQAFHLTRNIVQNRQSSHPCQNKPIEKMVVHSGFVPQIYFKEWQHDRALEFWKAYMQDKPPAFTICVENVMEEEPYSLTRLAEELNQKNIRLCLDIGHANRQGDVPLSEWIEVMAPYISHVHIHNNNGIDDEHNALEDGTIEMTKILEKLLLRCEEKTTFTIESLDGRRSLEWLDKEGYLKG